MRIFTWSTSFDLTDPYVLIIAASVIIVLSFIYNLIANRTNVPSVLLLIATGIAINIGLAEYGAQEIDMMPALEILGIVGLIMIVLEAALDLQISREKMPIIIKSLMVALLCLLGSAFAIAGILGSFYEMDFLHSLLYATPLSIMSSAIIIPSVGTLIQRKKEFMVYDGTFSDILGIMFFYFVISLLESGGGKAAASFGMNFIITIVVAIVASYALIYLFKDIKGHIRLFLLIAVLLILYAAGKLLHLSPLLIILVFGMALANHNIFFKVFKNYMSEDDPIEEIEKEFHLITLETAFVVRTFFFVVFGMTIALSSLVGMKIFLISAGIIGALYAIRFIWLKVFVTSDITPELWIAPRGLITILLFFAIPEVHKQVAYDDDISGIMLYVIIITSLVMTVALIYDKASSRTEEGEGSTLAEPAAGEAEDTSD